MSESRSVGRPAKFSNAEELEKLVNEYFIFIQGEFEIIKKVNKDGSEEPIKIWLREPESATITGLCIFLGFETRQSFYDYENNPVFSYTIKKARLKIEYEYEKLLNISQRPVAQIFVLKNLGWSDKQEIDMRAKVAASDEDTIFE
jgi:hypothetical protein